MARKEKAKRGRRTVGLNGLERLNVTIPRDLAEKLRVHCARTRTSLSAATEAALALYLKGQ